MPEPQAATPEAPKQPPAAPPKQPTESDRMQAAIAKGKELSGVTDTEAEAPAAEGEEAEQAEAAPEVDSEAKEKQEAEAKEKKAETKRAREWADIEKAKAEVSRREREAKRLAEETTRERAEFTKVQERYAELGRLFQEDPVAFIDRMGNGRPGGIRDLFERAVQQEKRTPEEEERAAVKRELEELKAWRKAREEADAKAKEDWEREHAARTEREQHQKNYNHVHEQIATLATGGGYPNVAAVIAHERAAEYVTSDVYDRILKAFDGGRGVQRNIPDVLDDVERELARKAGQVPPPEPPARTNGAVQPAKSEARPKRTPPTLTSATASARASAGRELKGEERLAHFASTLRRRPD